MRLENSVLQVEPKSGIYSIENEITKTFYIGKTKNIKRRFREHKTSLSLGKSHNKYLQNSYLKYGKDNFTIRVLEYCDVNLLNEKEEFWFKSINKTNKVFNTSRNFYVGVLNKGETYEEIYGKEKAIKIKEKISSAHTDKILSEEHKKNIGESLKGIKTWNSGLSEETDDRIKNWKLLMIEKYKTGEIKSKKGIKIPPEKLKLITEKRKGKTKKGKEHGNFGKIRTLSEKEIMSKSRLGKPSNRCLKVIIFGVEYNSIQSAAKELGIKHTTLLGRLKRKSIKFLDYKFLENAVK